MSYKRKNSLMILIFISCLIMILLLFFYTTPNETINFKNLTGGEYLAIVYKNAHPKFNWFHGLWLDFAAFFTILILEFLDFPNIFKLIDDKILSKIKRVNR